MNSSRILRRLHLALTIVWALLVIPTFVWWQSSILVVLFYSIYANIVGHWSAYQAARAEGDVETICPHCGRNTEEV